MNKEELRQYSAKLMAENITLMEDNKILMNRIDKAIEYLNQPYRDNFDYSRAELLDILKGENKE